jgi:hypothetical protein
MSMDFNSSDFKSLPGSMAWLHDRREREGESPIPIVRKKGPTSIRTGVAVAAIIVSAATLMGMAVLGPSKASGTSEAARPEAVRYIPLTVAENAALFSPQVTPTASATPTETPGETAPAETSPINGLVISAQSWRRGGLGSNAQVTFTLHNNNDYAVKDVAIACAFTRRDGSHLTDRTRTINDVISTKGKKTFVRLHVGFVNVFADKAKCSPVAADKI